MIRADGKLDITRAQTIARLGHRDHTVARQVFEIRIPDTGGEAPASLEAPAELQGRA